MSHHLCLALLFLNATLHLAILFSFNPDFKNVFRNSSHLRDNYAWLAVLNSDDFITCHEQVPVKVLYWRQKHCIITDLMRKTANSIDCFYCQQNTVITGFIDIQIWSVSFMPDGLCVTMPLGALNCASTKPLEKNEVEFHLVYPVFFHTSALYCFYMLRSL